MPPQSPTLSPHLRTKFSIPLPLEAPPLLSPTCIVGCSTAAAAASCCGCTALLRHRSKQIRGAKRDRRGLLQVTAQTTACLQKKAYHSQQGAQVLSAHALMLHASPAHTTVSQQQQRRKFLPGCGTLLHRVNIACAWFQQVRHRASKNTPLHVCSLQANEIACRNNRSGHASTQSLLVQANISSHQASCSHWQTAQGDSKQARRLKASTKTASQGGM